MAGIGAGLTVGHKLWYVAQNWGGKGSALNLGQEVEVTSVGRLWAKITPSSPDIRINLSTLVAEASGRSGFARCYRSKEEYQGIIGLNLAWKDLRTQLDSHNEVPAGVSLDDIAKASLLLRAGK